MSLYGSFQYTPLYRYISEVTEESGFRLYEDHEGVRYASTTTVLGKYEDKSTIEKWKKRTKDADEISATSAAAGTEAHKLIEDYLDYGEVPVDNFFAMIGINNFYRHVDPNYISVEKPLFFKTPEYRIAGRYDQLVKLKPNTFKEVKTGKIVSASYCICDLKTKRSYKKDKKGNIQLKELPRDSSVDFLFKNCLQASMYSATLSIQTDFKEVYGEGVTGAILVYVNEEQCKLMYLSREDLNYYWRVFKAILKDYYDCEKLNLTWKEMVNHANGRYDADLLAYVNNIPKEIIAIR